VNNQGNGKPEIKQPRRKILIPDVVKFLRRRSRPLTEVASHFKVAEDRILKDVISQAPALGYNLQYDPRTTLIALVHETRFGTTTSLATEGLSRGRKLTFMVISDIGLGLRTQQGRLLATCYQEARKRGVDFVIINGNVVGGRPTPRTTGDFFLTSPRKQVEYAIRALPRLLGVKQYVISGWRDLSCRTGNAEDAVDVGLMMAEARSDIRSVGDLRETLDLRNGTIITVVTLNSDQVTYTLSYALRGLAENMQSAFRFAQAQRHEPKLILIGGLLTNIIQPPRFPLRHDRRNNFYALSSYALHGMTPSQIARKKRGGSPELGCQFVTLVFDAEDHLIDIKFENLDLTAWAQFSDYYAPVEALAHLSRAEKRILGLLVEKPRTVGELSRIMDLPKAQIGRLVDQLLQRQDRPRHHAYKIVLDLASSRLTLERRVAYRFKPYRHGDIFRGKSVLFGYASDPHLGDKESRSELWTSSLRRCEIRKVAAGIIPGDLFTGTDAYPGEVFDLNEIGADAQRDFGLRITPPNLRRPYFLIRGSSHERRYWTSQGHDIVATFAKMYNLRAGREIMRYLGGIQAVTPDINGIRHLLLHPKGGATIGWSYRGQLWIENYMETVQAMGANVFAMGHLHIPLLFVYKGIPVVMVPSLEDQTEYLKGKTLMPYLGMWFITYRLDRLGNISSIIPEYIAYEPKV